MHEVSTPSMLKSTRDTISQVISTMHGVSISPIEKSTRDSISQMINTKCKQCNSSSALMKHLPPDDQYTGVLFLFIGNRHVTHKHGGRLFDPRDCRFCFYLSKRITHERNMIIGAVEFHKKYQRKHSKLRTSLIQADIYECDLYQIHSPLAVFDLFFRRVHSSEPRSLIKERLQPVWTIDEIDFPVDVFEAFWEDSGRFLTECVHMGNPPHNKRLRPGESMGDCFDQDFVEDSVDQIGVEACNIGVELGTSDTNPSFRLSKPNSVRDDFVLMRENIEECSRFIREPKVNRATQTIDFTAIVRFCEGLVAQIKEFEVRLEAEQTDSCHEFSNSIFFRIQRVSFEQHISHLMYFIEQGRKR